MEARILQLIGALRASGVRISLAESAEAFSAVDLMGIANKLDFRLSLQATLIKDSRDLPIFDRLFPLFFGNGTPPESLGDLRNNLSSEEIRNLSEALKELIDRIRQNIERLMEGNPLSRDELEQIARMVGLNNVNNLQYQNWMALRMERALGIPELQEAIKQLLEALQQAGFDFNRMNQLGEELQGRLQGIQDQIGQFAGERIAENLSRQPQKPNDENLMNRPFRALTEQEKRFLMKEVMRMAAALRTRIALRQKRAKTGQLDAKSTLRANLKHQLVPMEIRFRDRIKKPKIIVLCDISTSMRFCSELMLSFIHALQGQVKKTYAFAFIDHLEYISDNLLGPDGDTAVSGVLKRMPSGSYNTDLGWSLKNFVEEYLDTLNGRTTLIIVGDGRNNYNNPRLDLFKLMSQRASRTLWLNPEPTAMWGTGDSDMPGYAKLCTSVFKVGNLAELTVAIDHLMAA